MTRAMLTLYGEPTRAKACSWVMSSPSGTRLEFKAPRRSVPQSDKMWAMLTDISRQLKHHGLKLSAEDWKLLFLDALKRDKRLVPNLDGNGFVALGTRSSDLSKQEMSDMIELISAYGATHGVVWGDEREPV